MGCQGDCQADQCRCGCQSGHIDAQLIKQEKVLRDVIKDQEFQRLTWYAENSEDPVAALDEAISVSVIPDTNFIQISMTSTKVKEIPDILNTLARHFVRYAAETRANLKDKEILKLTAQSKDVRRERDRLRQQRIDAIGATEAAAMQERRSTVAIKLQMLARGITEAEQMQTQAQAALNAYNRDIQKGNIENSLDIRRSLDMDMALRQFEAQVYDLRSALNNARRILGPKHRTVRELESRLATTSEQTEARRTELIEQNKLAFLQIRQMAVEMATEEVIGLRERYRETRGVARDLEITLGRIRSLDEDVEYLTENLRSLDQSILARKVEQRSTGGGLTSGPVSIGAQATLPRMPSHPKWPLMSALAVVLGALLSFGLAFLLEMADTSIKGPGDLARRFDLPLLGMVPHSDDLDEEIEDFRRVVLTAPHSPAAEAFRQIRTNLLFSGPAERRRISSR